MKPDTKVNVAGIRMKNPVMVASGTFGSGKEYSQFVDLEKLGALVTKSVTLKERKGNPTPRLAETPSGVLNSIGLQNRGIDAFIKDDLTFLKKQKVPVIVSVAGESIKEYVDVAKKLSVVSGVDGIELNVSCPNVAKGGMIFGVSASLCTKLIGEVAEVCKVPLIVKLSPNVTDIAKIAKTAERAGACAISLVNTFLGMAINTGTFKPKLGNTLGGLSGPAIKPLALRMVWQVASSVKIPVIGMGGIMNTDDALEFLLAGASAVAVGTANFVDPEATVKIIDGLEKFLAKRRIKDINDVVGKVKV